MEENLIKQNPRDELLLKIRGHVDSQASAADNAKKINIYAQTFVALAKKYFGLDNLFLTKLDDQELKNLSSLIYDKAKRRLPILMPSFCLLILLAVPLLGIGIPLFYHGLFNKHDAQFMTYKLVILHRWFWERFTAAELKRNMPLC